jgi:4-hydroxybenzoate polyprenyltransferase
LSAAWKIVRPTNLAIIALVFILVRCFLWEPMAEQFGLIGTLSWAWYLLLLISCMSIAAGGYILNDIQDVGADQINKPEKVFVGKTISLERAKFWYALCSIFGLVAGGLCAWQIGRLSMLGVHIVSVVLLYMYATRWKKILVLGNLTVALLIFISVLTPILFEPSIYDFRRPGDWFAAQLVWKWMLGLARFSFILTLAREVVKDLQDMEGDSNSGDKTIPIVLGAEVARWIVSGLLFCSVFLSFKAGLFLEEFYTNSTYMIFAGVLTVGMMLGMWLSLNAKTKQHYARISLLIKTLMLAGLLVLPLHFFLQGSI